jgi:hypothetical protein
MLSNSIRNYWVAHGSQLPSNLAAIPGTHLDPITNQPYEYLPAQGSQYQLCAVFAAGSSRDEDDQPFRADPNAWAHPVGRHCFALDASADTPPPSYNPYAY